MFKNATKTALFGLVAAGSLAAAATADTVMFDGILEAGDGLWGGAGSGAAGDVLFDVVEFTVDTDGTYGFYSFYPGDVAGDLNMDGYIRIYENAFDSSNPATNQIASDDDYSDGDIALLDPFDDDAVGQNASGTTANLTAGTTYFMAQTTFTDAPTSFGQPNGPYESVITGPGGITIVPAPAALALLGVAGLAGTRRRRA